MKSYLNLLTFISLMLLFAGCKEESPNGEDPVPQVSAVYVINEGPFGNGTGTISRFDRNTGKVDHDLFEAVNGRPLGNIVQSMLFFDDIGTGYIVVNNANKVECVDSKMQSLGTLEGVSLPRYLASPDHPRGYLTSWDNAIYEVDLSSLEVLDTIPAGTGPELILFAGYHGWVLNKGGLTTDSTVTVFDYRDNTVVKTLTLAPKPTGIVLDKEGFLWILCHGEGWNGWPAPGDTPGKLFKLDNNGLNLVKEFSFPDNVNHPERLAINDSGDVLYFITPQGLFQMDINALEIPSVPLVARNATSFGLGYDPADDIIYLANPSDYQQNGYVIRYTVEGALVDSFMVGIIPSGFCFTNN